MATQKWFADDGSEHSTQAEAVAHDEIEARVKAWADAEEKGGNKPRAAALKAVRAFVRFEREAVQPTSLAAAR